jgi:RNA polymerase sigma-70 factor (ECF subfamily)
MNEWMLREFVRDEYSRLVAAVGAIAGSTSAAEDCVQEALVRAWQHAERGERIDNLAAWVTTVALNLSRNRLRRIRAEWRATDRMGRRSSPEPGIDRLDVSRAVARLPRRQREATVLRYYLDLDVAEVAGVMRAPVGTVKSLLFRARASLADALVADEMEVPGHDGR